MNNTEAMADLGVVRVRARLKAGKWTVRVTGQTGSWARGAASENFDEAMLSAVRCLRMVEVSEGKRAPRTAAQVHTDSVRGL